MPPDSRFHTFSSYLTMEDGMTAEMGLTGNDGVVGVALYDCGDGSHARNSQRTIGDQSSKVANTSGTVLCVSSINNK